MNTGVFDFQFCAVTQMRRKQDNDHFRLSVHCTMLPDLCNELQVCKHSKKSHILDIFFLIFEAMQKSNTL